MRRPKFYHADQDGIRYPPEWSREQRYKALQARRQQEVYLALTGLSCDMNKVKNNLKERTLIQHTFQQRCNKEIPE
jgi:hypothetical protein